MLSVFKPPSTPFQSVSLPRQKRHPRLGWIIKVWENSFEQSTAEFLLLVMHHRQTHEEEEGRKVKVRNWSKLNETWRHSFTKLVQNWNQHQRMPLVIYCRLKGTAPELICSSKTPTIQPGSKAIDSYWKKSKIALDRNYPLIQPVTSNERRCLLFSCFLPASNNDNHEDLTQIWLYHSFAYPPTPPPVSTHTGSRTRQNPPRDKAVVGLLFVEW